MESEGIDGNQWRQRSWSVTIKLIHRRQWSMTSMIESFRQRDWWQFVTNQRWSDSNQWIITKSSTPMEFWSADLHEEIDADRVFWLTDHPMRSTPMEFWMLADLTKRSMLVRRQKTEISQCKRWRLWRIWSGLGLVTNFFCVARALIPCRKIFSQRIS